MSNLFMSNSTGLGAVTVFDVYLCTLDGKTYSNALDYTDFTIDKTKKIDSLKISNLNQEGPRKTLTGGQNADPLIKYGKTTRLEMQDALIRKETLEEFFGFESIGDGLVATNNFPSAFGMIGKTYMIDRATGNKAHCLIFIPQFRPDAILNLALESEGDGAVMDLNGDVVLTKIDEKEYFYFIEGADNLGEYDKLESIWNTED